MITLKEVLQRVQNSEPLLIVEYRSASVDVIKWRDKTTGKEMTFTKITHGVELGPKAVTVSERVPEGLDVSKWVQSIPKGAKAVLFLETLTREKGITSASGTLDQIKD